MKKSKTNKYNETIVDPSVINIELDPSAITSDTKNVLIVGGKVDGLFGVFDRILDISGVEKPMICNNCWDYKNQTRFSNNILFFINCIKYDVNIYILYPRTNQHMRTINI